MNSEFEHNSITRAVEALEAIAEHLSVLATMALTSATPAAPKGKPGRPKKDTQLHVVGAPAAAPEDAPTPVAEPEAPAQAPQDAPATPAAPSEAERREKFDALRFALRGCLAMNGEDITRQRLGFEKFSAVPFDQIDATIERLEA